MTLLTYNDVVVSSERRAGEITLFSTADTGAIAARSTGPSSRPVGDSQS